MRKIALLAAVGLLATLGPTAVVAHPGHQRPKITVMRWKDLPVKVDRFEKLIVKAHDPQAKMSSITVFWGDGVKDHADSFCAIGEAGEDIRYVLDHKYQKTGTYIVRAQVESCDEENNLSRWKKLETTVKP